MSKPEREREVKDSAWLFRQCKTKITTKKDDEGRKMMSSRRNILHEAVGGSVLGVGGLPSWRVPRPIPPVRVVFQACRILGCVSRDPCRPRRIAAPFARLECDGEQLCCVGETQQLFHVAMCYDVPRFRALECLLMAAWLVGILVSI